MGTPAAPSSLRLAPCDLPKNRQQRGIRVFLNSLLDRNDLYRNFHALKGVGGTLPSTRERRGLFVVTGDRHRDMLKPHELVVGGVKTPPACARKIDFGPGV